MIRYIKGILEYSYEGNVVVEVHGIGYHIHVPLTVFAMMPGTGQEVKLFTYLYVREDAMILYGFLTDDDLDVFEKLISVNGIGPKGALGILSTLSTDELRLAIINEDEKTISKAPGIGKKTAQRLIIDLKDKLKLKDVSDGISLEIEGSTSGIVPKGEAISALVSLGYSNSEAKQAVNKVKDYTSVEELIKLALKQLSII